jgi:hypothetical protein
MKGKRRGLLVGLLYIGLAVSVTVSTGWAGKKAAKGAAQGATTGAAAGAVGGMMMALVFGGNVAEAGARGAVYGGTSGAVAGGMSGARADKADEEREQAEREAELAKFEKEVGTDAYNGVVALAECKHDLAIANGKEAAKSRKKDYALAGIWVEALAEADRGRDADARALFPEIIARDRKIKSEEIAEERMREALQELGEIRVEYGMPEAC